MYASSEMELPAGGQNEKMICVFAGASKGRGIFMGDNPFKFPTPVLLAQLIISALCTAILQFFLTPLGETAFVSQIIVGVMLGPSFIGGNRFFSELIFPPQSYYVCDTFAFFGVILFLFLVGLKTDLSLIKNPGKKALAIGFSSFFAPLILNFFVSFFLIRLVPMEANLCKSLYFVASLQSLSSFHVIVCLLADLNLVSTELGRLAISSSIISGTCSFLWTMAIFTAKQNLGGKKQHSNAALQMCVCVLTMLVVIVYVLRPIMLWMVRRIIHEKSMRESYILGVFVMILGCSLFGELVGQNFLFGPMILGFAVPDGPPLGSALITKLECFVSSILLPIYFVATGANIDVSLIHVRTFGIVEVLAFSGFFWKVIAAMLPSLYCKMPFNSAACLGLIMSSQGIVDVLVLGRAEMLNLIDKETYSIMVLSALMFTGAISPLVKFIYNPYKKYMVHKRRTIQDAKPNTELRILACIYHQDHTTSIINLLEASYPNIKTPICIYVIHLVELVGRAAPIFMAHNLPGKMNSTYPVHQSNHIINAFRFYEQQNQGNLIVNPFTAIAPYATMHDEVCELAMAKEVTIVILPFHKIWNIHGTEKDNDVRSTNLNILKRAPCSVGILVDRGTMPANRPVLMGKTLYSVGVIFLGGEDDREALAYGCRMAQHPNVELTLVRFIHEPSKKRKITNKISRENKAHDNEMIDEFKIMSLKTEYCSYHEEAVKDGVGMTSGIRKVENLFDLILIGRRHDHESPLFVGLMEWNEFPELGFIGDMLASSDSICKASILVVQQAAILRKDLPHSPNESIKQDSVVVNVPRDTYKVYPVS